MCTPSGIRSLPRSSLSKEGPPPRATSFITLNKLKERAPDPPNFCEGELLTGGRRPGVASRQYLCFCTSRCVSICANLALGRVVPAWAAGGHALCCRSQPLPRYAFLSVEPGTFGLPFAVHSAQPKQGMATRHIYTHTQCYTQRQPCHLEGSKIARAKRTHIAAIIPDCMIISDCHIQLS